MPLPQGRLELTWANKHLRLIAHEGGTYEWVEPADYRVAEVRLLHHHSAVGEVSQPSAKGNLLLRGDALHALRSLSEIPEYSRHVVGRARLCYIDPPFNTGQVFADYDDGLEHSVWLTMMRDRLVQIRRLLAEDGCVWVHVDDSEQHRLRCVMDEVFGSDNFVANVIWEKADSPRMDAQQFSTSHDTLVCYRKSAAWRPVPSGANESDDQYPYTDAEGRRYKALQLRKWGSNDRREDRPTMYYPLEAPDGTTVYPTRKDGSEGYWRWSREKYDANQHLIEWADRGNGLKPYVKTYQGASKPVPPQTLWRNDEVGHNREAKYELKRLFGEDTFATPKPERLMKRIIEISTAPGDLVVDCFVGSGTTAAVAQKLGRRWIACEWSAETIAKYTLPRLTHVTNGTDPGGVTAVAGWKGGSGFHVLDVAPSMYESAEGMVFLAGWVTNGALAEATAAQFSFEYDPSSSPFCGRKGRRRLAVVDGLVDVNVARLIVGALAHGEQVVIAGTSHDPEAKAVLPKGSTIRKIPDALLQSYQRQSRLSALVPPPASVGAVQ